MPGWVLIVTLQHVALWETVGEVDWSDAYLGFPLNQYTFGNFLAHCTFCLCLRAAYYILHFGQMHTASIACAFENRLGRECLCEMGSRSLGGSLTFSGFR